MEGEEVPNGSTAERKHKEELKVLIIGLSFNIPAECVTTYN